MAPEAATAEQDRPLAANVAELLGALAYHSGYTAVEMATDIGTSPLCVLNWMKGKTTPRRSSVEKIGAACGLSEVEVDYYSPAPIKPGGTSGPKKPRSSGWTKMTTVGSTEWMSEGKCHDLPPETFFPSDGVGVEIARRICADCPVKAPCLEYALRNRIEHGVWGGASERQRRRIARQRRSFSSRTSDAD